MNYLSRLNILRRPGDACRSLLLRALLLSGTSLAACGAPAEETPATEPQTRYSINYRVTPNPAKHTVDVELHVSQSRYLLREMGFAADRLSNVRGDGAVTVESGRVRWLPPKDGGTLSWSVDIRNQRNGRGFDAWLDGSWGLFRAEDIIPRAATRTLRGATSDTMLAFRLPDDWSVVSEYRSSSRGFRVRSSERRFVQPSGWIALGDLGVRRDRIAGIRVAVAAPQDQDVRRIDMLALLNWTLPELARLVPDPPARLTIVSAGDPMWRGGLSGPRSIFIHADRPLISENGTSTLLHEVAHVFLSTRAEANDDWIVEGFAEYYSLEILRRSGTLTPERYARALSSQQQWAESAGALCGSYSSGATTALAVVTLKALDTEIRQKTAGNHDLDEVLHTLLAEREPFSLELLRRAAAELIDANPDALHIDNLPGCRNMSAVSDTAS